MSQFFEYCIDVVLKNEGVEFNPDGSVKDSGLTSDTGGRTKFGISENYYGRDPSDLTLEQAKRIYESDFWLRPHCDRIAKIDGSLALLVFDYGVNAGTTTAIKALQQILALPTDGIVGPITLNGITKEDPKELCLEYTLEKHIRYAHLATNNSTKYEKYLAGWILRSIRTLDTARTPKFSGPKST